MPAAEPSRGSLLRLLVESGRALEDDLYKALRATAGIDLRPAHYAVFRHLEGAGSRVTELARSAGMTQQSMGELVTHLERQGYVERRPDPRDGRAKIVVPTAKGRAGLATAGAKLAELEAGLARRMGERELARLTRLLTELRGLLAP